MHQGTRKPCWCQTTDWSLCSFTSSKLCQVTCHMLPCQQVATFASPCVNRLDWVVVTGSIGAVSFQSLPGNYILGLWRFNINPGCGPISHTTVTDLQVESRVSPECTGMGCPHYTGKSTIAFQRQVIVSDTLLLPSLKENLLFVLYILISRNILKSPWILKEFKHC